VSAAHSILAGLDFSWLFGPVEHVDEWLAGLFEGAPLLTALGIAFLLGLRHASDPDHLVAVTSLIAADRDQGTRQATRLGAWWGLGHALALLVIGIPLILLQASLPGWLEAGAEKGIGLIILLLAARVVWKWVRGDYRTGGHLHSAETPPAAATTDDPHHHLRRGDEDRSHGHRALRTPQQAFGIGLLHGLAGTGAVVVLLIAAMPSQVEAVLALTVFAPMTIFSMTALTTAFAWVLTRPLVEPLYRAILIPSMGVFGILFGLWYMGLT